MHYKSSNIKRNSKAQTIIIVTMIMATIITVFLAMSFKSTTETQVVKLEEENQRALAAAQAALEETLTKNQAFNSISTLPNLGEFSGSTTITTSQSNQFVTPLIEKDGQYTFYLSTPNPGFDNLLTSFNNQTITVCSTSNNVALEISLIKSDNSIRRLAINPPSTTIIVNGSSATSGNTGCPTGTGLTFVYNYFFNVGSNNLLMIIRAIGGSTRIGLRASNNFPPQGRTIVSQASSKTVTKKIQLFQSYPQIPAEFFVTTF